MNTANITTWKAYAARDYAPNSPRFENYVEVNLPEYMPTLPQDNNYTNFALQSGYFVNTNYPIVTGTVKTVHYMKLPLLQGTLCPRLFSKGTPFILFTPTNKVEEGYLIYAGEGNVQ